MTKTIRKTNTPKKIQKIQKMQMQKKRKKHIAKIRKRRNRIAQFKNPIDSYSEKYKNFIKKIEKFY